MLFCRLAVCSFLLALTRVAGKKVKPTLLTSVAADQSSSLETLVDAYLKDSSSFATDTADEVDIRQFHKKIISQGAFSADKALDTGKVSSKTILKDPKFTFDGLNHEVNTDPLRRTQHNPPDPVGDVGKHHYVQLVKFAIAIYNKKDGTLESGPYPLGSLWQDFKIEGCKARNTDPIVLYDQFEGRWFFSQFAMGCLTPGESCFTCVAVSQSEDPTGPFNRYAFVAQQDPTSPVPGTSAAPDYPKWGVWDDFYILTTRDFYNEGFGVSVYAVEKRPMILGNKNTRVQRYSLVANVGDGVRDVAEYLYNDILLPPDIDGNTLPPKGSPAPVVGTVDAEQRFSEPWSPFDGLNIWELSVDWTQNTGSLEYGALIPVEPFTSVFECGEFFFGCVPQPGVDTDAYLDAISTFVMHRFAYRNKGDYETMTTCQAVQVSEAGGEFGTFGKRWYEIRRNNLGGYSVHQQGTFAPNDGVSRWVGSIAQDGAGNMAMGYSVSDAVSTFPGLRLTGRLVDDPLNFMTLGEATIVDGTGAQGANAENRWGDYSSMNIDSEDDCTFWFTGSYYTSEGAEFCEMNNETSCWSTHIASFELPGCKGKKKEEKKKEEKKKKEKKGKLRA